MHSALTNSSQQLLYPNRMQEDKSFYANLYLPEKITFEMWDDDISNMYKMDFISVLTSTLDDAATLFGNADNLSLKQESSYNYDQNVNIDNNISYPGPHFEAPSPSGTSDSYDSGGHSSTLKGWEEIPIKQWTNLEVRNWLRCHLRHSAQNTCGSLESLLDRFGSVDGLALSAMNLNDFLSTCSNYGNFLYNKLQDYLRAENNASNLHQLLPIESTYRDIPSDVVSLMLSDNHLNFPQDLQEKIKKEYEESSVNYLPSCLGGEYSNEQKQEDDCGLAKKRPGRPRGIKRRKQSEQRLGRLWEFIRDLLLSEKYCPKYICWDNYEEGKFRFVESDKVAKLWGSIKGNANMNYEKFSRAMRYYYKSEVLLPVEGRRLVYKFGPKATGWRTNNPNFQL